MSFEKGQSGNPGGRPKDKPWRDALRMALKDGDGMALRRIAESVIRAAESGDMQAIKEIGDRMDGKPAQQTIVTGDEDGGALRVLTEIRRTIVKPDA